MFDLCGNLNSFLLLGNVVSGMLDVDDTERWHGCTVIKFCPYQSTLNEQVAIWTAAKPNTRLFSLNQVIITYSWLSLHPWLNLEPRNNSLWDNLSLVFPPKKSRHQWHQNHSIRNRNCFPFALESALVTFWELLLLNEDPYIGGRHLGAMTDGWL